MGRELSDVFKAKTRVGKRKVLDKFDISKEDKNKFLNGIEDVGSSGGESGGGDIEANAEYYRIDWDKLNELGYTDDNFNNNASYFTRNSFFYCSKYKMEAQGDSGMMDMRDLWITITMMSAYFKYSFITQVEFVPFTDSNGETFNSLQDAWRWSSQPFNEIFIPITKEQFYSLE